MHDPFKCLLHLVLLVHVRVRVRGAQGDVTQVQLGGAAAAASHDSCVIRVMSRLRNRPLGLVGYSEDTILCSLSATKPHSSISKPSYEYAGPGGTFKL